MKAPTIKYKIRKLIKKALNSHKEIIFAYIFGSFAEIENTSSFNDIDIAIYIDEKNEINDVFYEINLSNKLENLIKVPVDIIRLNTASDVLIYRATQGILIKNVDDNLRINFITTSWKKYWDFQKLIEEHLLELKSDYR
ncbi:MAG: nucleotidyltransferase domain-containing protein [Atribacterota bacterium]